MLPHIVKSSWSVRQVQLCGGKHTGGFGELLPFAFFSAGKGAFFEGPDLSDLNVKNSFLCSLGPMGP